MLALNFVFVENFKAAVRWEPLAYSASALGWRTIAALHPLYAKLSKGLENVFYI